MGQCVCAEHRDSGTFGLESAPRDCFLDRRDRHKTLVLGLG